MDQFHIIWLKIVVLVFLLIVISVDDMRHFRIKNEYNIILLVAGCVSSFWLDAASPATIGFGIAVGLFGGWAVQICYQRIRGRAGLGSGDVKFLGAAGAWVGAAGLSPLILVASLTALAYALAMIILKLGTSRDRIAFGPFLGLGLLFVVASHDSGWAPWLLP